MPVTDVQVEVMRASLSGDQDVAREAVARGERLGDMDALLQMALSIAACRVFAPSWSMPMVIEFVALVRNDYAGVKLPFGATDAERELRRALGDKVPPPDDFQKAEMARMCLLRVLKDVLELDADGVAALLAEARPMADRALAQAGNGAPEGASPEAGLDRSADEKRSADLEQRVRALEEREARREAEQAAEISQLRSGVLALVARMDALEAGRGPSPGPRSQAGPAFGDWNGGGSNQL